MNLSAAPTPTNSQEDMLPSNVEEYPGFPGQYGMTPQECPPSVDGLEFVTDVERLLLPVEHCIFFSTAR